MDFEELIYKMDQKIFSLARSVRCNSSSVLDRDERMQWSSYVITAGDDIVDALLCSTVDVTSTLRMLRKKYEKASRLSKRINPMISMSMFDVYVIVLDEIASFMLEQEAMPYGN